MIRRCQLADTGRLYFIINEAAKAYEGKIPTGCYHQPYMIMDELEQECGRITFYGWEARHGKLVGIMGFELIKDVTLIRHTYVLPKWQGRGIASKLLAHLKEMVTTPRLLVGTWADAKWAISFYEKRGFKLLPNRNELLETYWNIPHRQIETSVVLGMEAG